MVYLFLGTTAEYIKLIPVLIQLKARKIPYRLILSGQTDFSLDEFKAVAGLQKSYHTFVAKSTRSSSSLFAIWALKTLVQSILWGWKELRGQRGPRDTMIVQGDTVSALIGSLLARFYGLRLVHVEAGLRTYNLLEPFPEEICRTVISLLAHIHFCPTQKSVRNLHAYPGRKINMKFNTSIESLHLALTKTKADLKLPTKKKYFIFIVHRQEHLYLRKDETAKLLNTVFANTGNIVCYFLIHDVTGQYLENMGLTSTLADNPKVFPIPRMPFLKFVHLLNEAEYLITDGGGNHTECYYLGKPCLILRKKSEQTEGVGENIIVSENRRVLSNFMKNYKKYKRSKIKVNTWPSQVIMENIAQ